MNKKYLVGRAIKHFRKQASMSQASLANQLSMARTTIVAIEQNKRPLTEFELPAFEKALFIDAGTLSNEKIMNDLQKVHIHINFGHRTGKREKGEKCWHCSAKPEALYYTYFGAPLCAECWDSWWLTTEDGECDPPSASIKNLHSGVWL